MDGHSVQLAHLVLLPPIVFFTVTQLQQYSFTFVEITCRPSLFTVQSVAVRSPAAFFGDRGGPIACLRCHERGFVNLETIM